MGSDEGLYGLQVVGQYGATLIALEQIGQVRRQCRCGANTGFLHGFRELDRVRGAEDHHRCRQATTAITRGFDAEGVVALNAAFQGNGLRPYSVCHLKKRGALGADIDLDWIRRTRIDGDSWQSIEVPLGEESERYRLQVFSGATLLREVTTTQPGWTYPAALQAVRARGARITWFHPTRAVPAAAALQRSRACIERFYPLASLSDLAAASRSLN